MKTFTILIVLLSISYCISADTCRSCLEINKVCDVKSNICDYGTMCVKINSTTSLCTYIPTEIGEDCSVTKQCANGLSCDGNNGNHNCTAEKYLGFGEKCTNDDQCTSNMKCNTTTNVCTNAQYPTCQGRGQCPYNETCYNNQCVAFVEDGKACNSGDQCHDESDCENNVCVGPFTVQEGGSCDDFHNCDISKDLVCLKDKCTRYSAPINCTVGPGFDGCPDGSVCMCDGTNTNSTYGTCHLFYDLGSSAKNTFSSYINCARSSKCPYVENVLKGSCLSKCGSSIDSPTSFRPPCGSNSATTIAINTLLVLSVILIAILISVLKAQTCLQCSDLEKSCDHQYSVCPSNSKCVKSGANYLCKALPDLNEDCTLTGECLYNYHCQNNKCIEKEYLGYGEKCNDTSTTAQCAGNLKCVNSGTASTCTNQQDPNCESREDCAPGKTCFNKLCIDVIADGKPCEGDDQCEYQSSCLGNPKTCTMPLTALENGECNNLEDCDFTKNLLCYKGKCVTVDSIENSTCEISSSNNCPSVTRCMCSSDGSTGKCKNTLSFSGITKEKYIVYIDCIRHSQCPFVEDPTKDSCIFIKCGASPLDFSSQHQCDGGGGNSANSIVNNSLLAIMFLVISLLFNF